MSDGFRYDLRHNPRRVHARIGYGPVTKENMWYVAGEVGAEVLLEDYIRECPADVNTPCTQISSIIMGVRKPCKVGISPLCHAIYKGIYKNVSVLVRYGADINATVDKFGEDFSPLVYACQTYTQQIGCNCNRVTDGRLAEQIKIIELLIANGAVVNLRNRKGLTALHYAVKNNLHQIVKVLLEKGAVFYLEPRVDIRPYVSGYCLKSDRIQTFERLLQHFSIDERKELLFREDKNILWWTTGSCDLVGYVLDKCGVDVNLRNHEGLTALQYAVKLSRYENVTCLLENGAEFYREPFVDVLPFVEHCSYYSDTPQTLEKLLQRFTRDQRKELVIEDKCTLWEIAGKDGTEQLLEYLLGECAIEVDTVNDTPDDIATSRSKLGRTPLLHAIYKGNYRNVRILVRYGAAVNTIVDKRGGHTNSSLMQACLQNSKTYRQQMKIVCLLLTSGADVNLHNHEGMTALHYAVKNNKREVVKILLESGAEFNPETFVGVLPYVEEDSSRSDGIQTMATLLKHWTRDQLRKELFISTRTMWKLAGEGETEQLLEYLLHKCGADVDSHNDNPDNPSTITEIGRTPLLHAVHEARYDNVKVLVRYGADINARVDKLGENVNPPLIHACQLPMELAFDTCQQKTQVTDIVEFLIKSGAVVNLRNHDGLTALHYAASNYNPDVIKVLLENGAEYYWDGFVDVLPYAAMFAREAPVNFLIENTKQPDRVIADAYEVLGACRFLTHYWDRYNLIPKVTDMWERAMKIRCRNDNPFPKILPNEKKDIFHSEREPQTMQELRQIVSCSDQKMSHEMTHVTEQEMASQQYFRIGIHSLLIYERLIGENSPKYMDVLEKNVHWLGHPENPSYTENQPKFLAHALLLCLKHGFQVGRITSLFDNMCRFDVQFERSENKMGFLNTMYDVLILAEKQIDTKLKYFQLQVVNKIFYYSLYYFAVISDNSESNLIKSLLEFFRKLAKLNPVDEEYRNFLHIATNTNTVDTQKFVKKLSKYEVVRQLVQSGFDINWRDVNGNTCLMTAIENSNFDIVPLLLESGSHCDVRNKFGESCRDIMRRTNASSVSTKLNNSEEIRLECLSARALADSDIPYEDIVPRNLLSFVNLHNKHIWSVQSCMMYIVM